MLSKILKDIENELETLKAEHCLNEIRLTRLEKLLSSPLLDDKKRKTLLRECVKLSSILRKNALNITGIELKLKHFKE